MHIQLGTVDGNGKTRVTSLQMASELANVTECLSAQSQSGVVGRWIAAPFLNQLLHLAMHWGSKEKNNRQFGQSKTS